MATARQDDSLDLFSTIASSYSQYRPTYPDSLFDFVFQHVTGPKRRAWDVGTGSGQAALKIAEAFEEVIATDISAEQLKNATPRTNITYAVTAPNPSEEELSTVIGPAGSVDLVTIAQAYHWMDFNYFHGAVKKVLRPGGVVAAWTYSLAQVSPEFDQVMAKWYERTWQYWKPQRKYIDDGYGSIPFPYAPLPDLEQQGTGPITFSTDLHWSLHHFFGYLSSWSPVATGKGMGIDLLDAQVRAEFAAAWGEADKVRPVHFPMFLRIGTVKFDD